MTSTPPRRSEVYAVYSPRGPSSVNGAAADDRQSDGGDSRASIVSPNHRTTALPRRPFGTPVQQNVTPNGLRRDSGLTTPPTAVFAAHSDGTVTATGNTRSPPPQGALPPLSASRSFGAQYASPRPEGSFVPVPIDQPLDDQDARPRTTTTPATVLRTISKHVRNRGGGSRVQAEELTDMIPHLPPASGAPAQPSDDKDDRESIEFRTDTCVDFDVPVLKSHKLPSDDPSTQPEAFESRPHSTIRPPPRAGARGAAGAAAPVPYQGEHTKWTLVDNRIALVWLLVLIAYGTGVFAMGVACWRVAANIPSKADALRTSGSGDTNGATQPAAVSDGPCGNVIPQVLIAIAFFTVVFTVLMAGWLVFFGLLVLPKLQQYRPGVGQVPFKVLSVFTPFVGYTALVVISLGAAVGVSLYGLSLTPEANSYAENVCGSPFTTLKAVSISLVATTSALIVAYVSHSAFLYRKAKRLNRSAFDENIRHQVVVRY